MFRTQQQPPLNQYSEKSINPSHTYPGSSSASGTGSGTGLESSRNLRQSASGASLYDSGGYNTNSNKVTFSPESLLFTPREKATQGQKVYSNASASSNLMDMSSSLNTSSNNAMPTSALIRWEGGEEHIALFTYYL